MTSSLINAPNRFFKKSDLSAIFNFLSKSPKVFTELFSIFLASFFSIKEKQFSLIIDNFFLIFFGNLFPLHQYDQQTQFEFIWPVWYKDN